MYNILPILVSTHLRQLFDQDASFHQMVISINHQTEKNEIGVGNAQANLKHYNNHPSSLPTGSSDCQTQETNR